MNTTTKWAFVSLATISLFGAVGCGQIVQSNSSSPQNHLTSTSLPTNHTASTPDNRAQNATNKQTSGSQTSDKRVHSQLVVLESIQASPNSILIMTTHGNMQNTYQDPKLVNGVFTVALTSVSLGTNISADKTYTQNGMSYRVSRFGADLKLTVHFVKPPKSFTSGIGGGDMINFIFK
jgi:hypothetical protein